MKDYVSPLQRRPSLVRALHRDGSAPKEAIPCILDKIPIEDLLLRVQHLVDEAFQFSASEADLVPHPKAVQRRRVRAILASLFRSTLGGPLDPSDKDILEFDIQSRKALVFCFLRLKNDYTVKAGGKTGDAELQQFRATVCEVLATECVQYAGWTMAELQTEVLTYRFHPLVAHSDGSESKPEDSMCENALECVISHSFSRRLFVS